MKILAARKYPNPRNGSLSQAEAETRRLAGSTGRELSTELLPSPAAASGGAK